ncbi:MAG: PQQ-binding-like beta-propeller repeat protein [Bacteroidales bacterium]
MHKLIKNTCVLTLLIATLPLHGQDAPIHEWRGTDRLGIYHDSNLLTEWPEAGPDLVWEYEGVGNGYGSPVFTPDNKMYIMGETDSLAWLMVFDHDGNFLWKKDFGHEWVKNYNGSRCAPTIAGDEVYVTSGMGTIHCFNRHTGEKIWSIDMVNDLGGEFPLFGYSEAVAIEGNRMFCTPGGPVHNVVALNRFTGEPIWSNPGKGERSAYNQPKIITLPERSILVTFSAYAMLGLDTQSGEMLWSHEQDNIPVAERKPGNGDTHSNTVLYEDGFIYYVEGDGNCAVKLALSPDGREIREVWRNRDFDSYMGGFIKLGDWMYGCGVIKPAFRSLNAQTGESGTEIKTATGAVISAGGMLYYYNFRGEVMLIKPDGPNMEVVSKFRITKGQKEHFAHPVIHKGLLYVRHGNVLQAFQITGS